MALVRTVCSFFSLVEDNRSHGEKAEGELSTSIDKIINVFVVAEGIIGVFKAGCHNITNCAGEI